MDAVSVETTPVLFQRMVNSQDSLAAPLHIVHAGLGDLRMEGLVAFQLLTRQNIKRPWLRSEPLWHNHMLNTGALDCGKSNQFNANEAVASPWHASPVPGSSVRPQIVVVHTDQLGLCKAGDMYK